MEIVNTGVSCQVCTVGDIVAKVESVATDPISLIPIGPASKGYYRMQVTAFYCQNCKLVYHEPPGRPNAAAEIVAEIEEKTRRREEAVTQAQFDDMIRGLEKNLRSKKMARNARRKMSERRT